MIVSLKSCIASLFLASILASPVLAARLPKKAALDGGSDWTPSSSGCQSCSSSNGAAVQVCPGDSIEIKYTVQLTSGSDWDYTGYTIEGFTEQCLNLPEPNATSNGTYHVEFTITAPLAAGTYDLTLDADTNSSCTSGSGGNMTLTNAITVVSSTHPQCCEATDLNDDTCDGVDDDCDGVVDEDAEGCELCGSDLDACVYIMVDRTGSMDSGSLADERDAAKGFLNFLSGLTDSPPVAIGTFGCNGSGFPADGSGHQGYCSGDSDDACTLQSLSNTESPAPYGDDDGSTSDGDHYSFVDRATATQSSTGTHFACALDVVNTELGHGSCPSGKDKILIFISDGGDQDSQANTLAAASHLKTVHGVEVFTILFPPSGGVTLADQERMEAIASEPKSEHYYLAPNSNELMGIFDLISEQVLCEEDGTFCNGSESCVEGSCVSSGNPCTGGTPICCEASESCGAECCSDASCSDGNACTVDSCVGGVCVHDPVSCPGDGLFCTGVEACDPGTGQCLSPGSPCGGGTPVCCEDSDACVAKCCTDADCHDGDNCTTDACVGGACQNGPVVCNDDGEYCNGAEACNPADGQCHSPGNPCGGGTPVCCESADVCEEECCEVADCDDGNACTTDACVSGVCQNTPVSCNDDGIYCNGNETCDPGSGICISSGNPCSGMAPVCCESSDVCAQECCFDADCDDQANCTNDACVAGVCQYTPVHCNDDGTYCNGNEVCDPGTGMCISAGNPCGGMTPICCEAADVCEEECCVDADCDDGLQCTTDACVAGVCQNTPVHCNDDGSFCNGGEVCDPGTGMCVSAGNPCGGMTPICCEAADVCEEECCLDADCDDADLCTTDACVSGVCQNSPVTCNDDGSYCTGAEVCDPGTGMCVSAGNPCGGTTPICCEDSDSCVSECCDNGDCPGDGLFCTGENLCVLGACKSTGGPCGPNEICCESSNMCEPECCDNADCFTDGLYCNGDEVCVSGLCESSGNPCGGMTPICCEAADVCEEECCLDADCGDADLCTTDACVSGVCQYAPVTCPDNGAYCDGAEVCDANTGTCVSAGDPCGGLTPVCCEVADVCEEECCFDADCDDADLCSNDACVGGICQNTPVNCPNDGLFCNGQEFCNPSTGMCMSAGNPCGGMTPVCCETADVCEEECCSNAECNDGLKCTTDACVAGVCQNTLVTCSGNGVFCDGVEVCDPASGACVSPGSPCSSPTGVCCQAGHVCEEECCSNLDCEDGDLCTTDTCVSGMCQYPPVTCPGDGAFCNGIEACNPTTGMCASAGNPCAPPTGTCCESSDTCVSECCANADCNDGDNCTTDTCVSGACQNSPVICPSDGQFCNGPEVCNPANGQCMSQGNPCIGTTSVCCEFSDSCAADCCSNAECSDSSVCTTDLCVGGVCNHPLIGNCCVVNGDCDDGDMCTQDSCMNNLCVNSEIPDCRPVIPTTTHWGIAILTLLLLIGGRVYFGRRRAHPAQ